MATRQTSIDCYNQIAADGTLSKLKMEVLKSILDNAPCTSAEALSKILTKDKVLSQSRARFTELRDIGVIYEVGRRKCDTSGRTVIVWDLTDKLPQPYTPKKVQSTIGTIYNR